MRSDCLQSSSDIDEAAASRSLSYDPHSRRLAPSAEPKCRVRSSERFLSKSPARGLLDGSSTERASDGVYQGIEAQTHPPM